MIALLALPLALLGLQQSTPIADRLAGRVSPDLAALVHELGAAAAARGLPVDPLIQKAIEGSAKGIPGERVAAAVRRVVMQLDTAAGALRDAGAAFASDTVAIEASAFALTAGLSGRDIAHIARSERPVGDVIVGLRVAGTLVAMGVPPGESVTLVGAILQGGRSAAEMLALPGRVQTQMAKGVPPAQAAAGLARAAAAQGRRGPPPARPQPPPHPAPPPHP